MIIEGLQWITSIAEGHQCLTKCIYLLKGILKWQSLYSTLHPPQSGARRQPTIRLQLCLPIPPALHTWLLILQPVPAAMEATNKSKLLRTSEMLCKSVSKMFQKTSIIFMIPQIIFCGELILGMIPKGLCLPILSRLCHREIYNTFSVKFLTPHALAQKLFHRSWENPQILLKIVKLKSPVQ